MNIKKEDIKTFIYEGNDKMIDFGSDKIPLPPSVFKAQLRLKNGKQITAPTEWRVRIWNWWYVARKGEIEDDVLIQTAQSMVAKPPSYRSDFVEIIRDGERIPASRRKIGELRRYLGEK